MSGRVFTAFLLAIVAGAFAVRVAYLSRVPNGFYIDEASFGYNAYSLLKTGRDEYGVRWPLYTRSFYSGKNPVYLYSTVASVRVFGLNEFAVRLPAAIFGTLAVLFTGLLAAELFGGAAGLVAALVAAVGPWGFMFSRTAMEPTSLLCAMALAGWLAALGLRRAWVAPAAGAAAGLSLYCYAPAFAIAPPMALLFGILFRKRLKEQKGPWLIGFAVLLLAALPHLFPSMKGTAQTSHFFGNLVTSPAARGLSKSLVEDMHLPFSKRIESSVAATGMAVFARNYLASYGPSFLFLNGDTSTTRQYVRGAGVLYFSILPFALIGLYTALRRRRPEDWFVIGWFVLYPVGASLAAEWVPSAIREIAGLPAWAALTGLGLSVAWGAARTAGSATTRIVFAAVLTLSTFGTLFECGRFFTLYFRDYPVYGAKAWGYGIAEGIEDAERIRNRYDAALVSHEIPFVYIYLLFYLKYDPETYQAAPLTWNGYNFEGTLGRYLIGPPKPCRAPYRCLYIGWIPRPEFAKTLEIIRARDGSPAVYLMESRGANGRIGRRSRGR